MKPRFTMKHRLALLCASLWAPLSALVVAAPSPAFATAPGTVVVEGVLSSTGGGPVADGGYDVVFSIWDKVKAGTPLWSEKLKIVTRAGRFAAVLGENKPIDGKMLVAKGGNWLGLAVGTDPELPRTPLHSTLYARWAAAAGHLQCAGCVGAAHIASGAIGGTKVGFNYAGSDTKGGSALQAKALSCTGCVTVAQLKFDQDVDLGARNLKTTGTIAAHQFIGNQFLGDGSKLTGIKTPAGTCSKAGEVVKGIDANGQLICVKAMDPAALPSNGLNEISNQALSNEFNDVISGGQNKPIPDFNANGLLDTITVPDIGNADSFEVYVEITKEPFDDNKPADGKPDWDTTDLTVLLFAPTTAALKSPRSNYVSNFTTKPTMDQKLYPHYVLHQQTGKGFLKLVATYPTKTKPVFGDIHKDWLGKNPKGKWQLLILDNQDRVDNKTGKDLKLDGKLVSWHIKMSTTSGNQVLASGQQFVGGKLWGKYNGHDKVHKGGKLGGALTIGNDATVEGKLKVTGGMTVAGTAMFGGAKVKCEPATMGRMSWSEAAGMQICQANKDKSGKVVSHSWVIAKTRKIIWSGGCTSHGVGSGWATYCLNGLDFNNAGKYFSVNGNGTITFKISGYYRMNFYAIGYTSGYRHIRFMKNGSDYLYNHMYGPHSGWRNLAADQTWYFAVGDTFYVSVYASNGYRWHSWNSHGQHSRLQVEFVGRP